MSAKKALSDAWERHHNVGRSAGPGPAQELFTDNDPATTIKGCGFRNAAVAARTIELAQQPGCRYKTYWTIRAMRERAARHPHQSESMRTAIAVFDSWLEQRAGSATELPAEEAAAERAQREVLATSFANAHARRNCSSDQEFARVAREDRTDSLAVLRRAAVAAAACLSPSSPSGALIGLPGAKGKFAFRATSFVALFGGPGEHGYGSHTCLRAHAVSLPRYRCVCGYRGAHRIDVVRDSREELQLGTRFPFQQFALDWVGASQEAHFLHAHMAVAGGQGAGGSKAGARGGRVGPGACSGSQPSILAFVKRSASLRADSDAGEADQDQKRRRCEQPDV
jgi:hypothetical protein|eukprot:Tamp_17710.p1 GENE.Tamp_17710~~Tamp_17710.p1  ORF type:complete len:339 (+),score=53.41 Tamp_17710:94-1110(+)